MVKQRNVLCNTHVIGRILKTAPKILLSPCEHTLHNPWDCDHDGFHSMIRQNWPKKGRSAGWAWPNHTSSLKERVSSRWSPKKKSAIYLGTGSGMCIWRGHPQINEPQRCHPWMVTVDITRKHQMASADWRGLGIYQDVHLEASWIRSGCLKGRKANFSSPASGSAAGALDIKMIKDRSTGEEQSLTCAAHIHPAETQWWLTQRVLRT